MNSVLELLKACHLQEIFTRQIKRNVKLIHKFKSGICEIIICLMTCMMPAIPLVLTYVTELSLLFYGRVTDMKSAVRFVAKLWVGYLRIWHNHSIKGMENIPRESAGLIVWYHGPVPVDYMGLVAQIHLTTGRKVWSVVDRCLSYVPYLEMFTSHLRCGSFSKVNLSGLLEAGELVGVSPGGARECLFDDNYSLMWRNRMGYAKVARLTGVPIIPVYTENIRLAYTTLHTGKGFLRSIFEATKLPFVPFYGGFPVELITHVGAPIYSEAGESVEELHSRVQGVMKDIIHDNRSQMNLSAALRQRFS